MDERKSKASGKFLMSNQKEITCVTAVGVKQGRTKRNEQEAKYENLGRMHEKSGRKERGRRKKRNRKTSTEEIAVRWRREERNGRNRSQVVNC